VIGGAAGPIVPDYAGACIAGIFPALMATERSADWLPDCVRDARQVVVLVLDGLGWLQFQARLALAPTLAGMQGRPIQSVVPSTTSTALTSITLALPPGSHGVVGYRVHVGEGAVLNVLRWRTSEGDALERVPPIEFQGRRAFGGTAIPVVTRAEFERTGFTHAFLAGARFTGYRTASSIAVEVQRLLAQGEAYVYAYYDGVDKVAHAYGFGDHYDAELVTTDRIVADIAASLPRDAALLVTADHGQVEVGDRMVRLAADVLDGVEFASGEARFRWLHTKPGAAADVLVAAKELEARELAWVRTRDEAEAEGWFGAVSDVARARLGDVVVAARAPLGFVDDGEPDVALVCRHGSLTEDEMFVPLLALRA
jgi:hypothetical protein